MSGEGTDITPGQAAILRELDQLRADFKDHREEVSGNFGDVLTEQRKTNGRLRKNETAIAWLRGAISLLAFLIGVASPFVLYYVTHR